MQRRRTVALGCVHIGARGNPLERGVPFARLDQTGEAVIGGGSRAGRCEAQEGHLHAPAPARDHQLLGRQGHPSGAGPARRRGQGHHAGQICRSSRRWPRGLEFAKFTLQVFKDIVLKNAAYVKLITSDAFTHRTYYMGMVDKDNKVNFYDGHIRVVTPEGKEYAKFPVQKYLTITSTWSPGATSSSGSSRTWAGRASRKGAESGVYAVAPLARLNAADGMATPEAQKAYEEYFKVLGGKPVHHTLANH